LELPAVKLKSPWGPAGAYRRVARKQAFADDADLRALQESIHNLRPSQNRLN
jgi:hypothetical protein